MSYEHKDPLAEPQLPPYGAQSPPPVSQQMYPPPAEIGRSQSGQYHQQPPAQQAQYAPQQGQYAQYPPQGQYPQQPQPPHSQFAQQGYQQQPAHSGGQVYQTAVPLANLMSSPAPAQCPSCGQRAMTRTTFVTGNTTHGWAAGLCAVLCLGCIPYFVTSMKDVEHRCGNCGVHLATWHRSGRTEVRMFA